MEFNHISVLLNETVDSLEIKPDGIYIDGTAGGAGHSAEIAKKIKSGMLYALDRDPDAVKIATERLSGLPAKVIKSNFSEMAEVMKKIRAAEVNAPVKIGDVIISDLFGTDVIATKEIKG